MKATEQYFPGELFILLQNVVLTFESVNEFLYIKCNSLPFECKLLNLLSSDASCIYLFITKKTHPFVHNKLDQGTLPQSVAPLPAAQAAASAVLCAVAVMSNVSA